MKSFHDKVVVITGASDGIGAELARTLARQRARLVIAARGIDALNQVAADCVAAGAQVLAVRTDVGVETDCRNLIGQTLDRFGCIDALVNNAGVSGHAMFEEVTDFTWYEDMMRVNFFGSLWCTRHALPHLKKTRGLIVGVSSLAGKIGVPGRTAYSPSKFAMAGFFDALRIELRGTGVDVTMIYPGVVATQIRYHGYGPDGKAAGKSGLEEKGAMSTEECVERMLEAMTSRKRELVMTVKARIGLWLKLIAPKKVDDMALAALKK
ncbi:MAG: short chain dehydrogenase [Herminiimonas sp.]|nr:short chain dehydrogenase [Herminiimonas sp.]